MSATIIILPVVKSESYDDAPLAQSTAENAAVIRAIAGHAPAKAKPQLVVDNKRGKP